MRAFRAGCAGGRSDGVGVETRCAGSAGGGGDLVESAVANRAGEAGCCIDGRFVLSRSARVTDSVIFCGPFVSC